jgi:putative phosphoesterase
MRVAVLSDIHANIFALQRVEEEMQRQQVEIILLLGDIIGYFYYPKKVLDLLGNWNCYTIRGNHEDILSDISENYKLLPHVKEKYGSGHKIALHELSITEQKYLFDLPETRTIEIDGLSIYLAHGAPWDKNAYIYPDCKQEVLGGFANYHSDIFLIGHTHYPCCFHMGQSLVINPGSVGQSREYAGRADWVLFDTSNRSFRFMSSVYDTSQILSDAREIDSVDSYNYRILLRNKAI